MKKLLLTLIIISAFCTQTFAQCLLSPVLLNQRISNCANVIEGKVINKISFWDPTHSNISTSNLIEVYKNFKNTSPAYIELITEGGTVGNERDAVSPSLELSIGDVGIFTLNPNSLPSQFGKTVYEAYAGPQGFIRYNVTENEANEPFKKYINLTTSLYSEIQLSTQTSYSIVKPINPFFVQAVNSTQAVAAITGFSPSTITAGTFSILTINGSGFGVTQGTSFVELKRADDGGATFCRPDAWSYVAWSDNQIQVRVTTAGSGTLNSTPGSGVIRVDIGGIKTTTTASLTITHAQMNVYSSASTPITIYNTRHVNRQAGGYSWQMYTGFDSNTAAKASFLRAFQSWRCGTYINWTSTTTTTINTIANDGANVIRFDVGTELPTGVLGRCTSRWSGCGTQPNQNWFVNELDIVFDDGTNWNFGPAGPGGSQYDFESVAVHELGHGHQLGHVINNSEIMNYSISNGQSKRVLSVNDLAGGNALMVRNLTGGVCANTVMTALSAGNCVLGAPTASFTVNRTTVCPGQTVVFTNLSTGTPTAYAWIFAGGTPSTSAVTNPTITYNTPGSYSVQLIATNANGTSTYSIAAYINVTTPASLPLSQTFQTALFPPSNWYINDAGNDNIKWKLTTSAGFSSTQSTVFDNWTDSITPTKDELKTYVNLAGFSTAKMTFYRSYSQTFAAPYIDTLQIGVSTNCGTSTIFPYLKGGSQLATATTSSSSAPFTPTATTQWVKDSIDLTPYVGQTNVMVAFINRGHYGDAIYLDNINITGVAATSPTAAISSASVGCTGTPIALNDASTGGPTSWTWTMPGGTTSSATTQNTSVTYTSAGVKTITLTVANGSGTTTATKSITITATPTVVASITNTTICSGNSVNVVLSGAATYVWLPSGLGSASTLSPTTTTIYTVTGSSGGCASAPKNFTINVAPTPTVNVTASSTTICAGQTVTMTASGAVAYTWNPGGLISGTVVVTPTTTTTYTVNGTTGGCSATRTITINVSSTPTVVTSITNTTICSGTSINVTVTGATTYTWLPSGSGASSTLSPTTTTVYTVTGSIGACASAPKNFTISVTPSPTTNVIASSTNICAGQTVTLTASGASVYSWMPGAQTTTVIIVNPTTTTTYTVNGSNGGCSSSKTITINITPTPTIAANPTNTTICNGSNVTCTLTGACTYTWMPGGFTGAVLNVIPSSGTTYTAIGSCGGCNSNPQTVTINVTSSPVISSSVANVTCFGVCNATCTLTPTGGTAPYMFSLTQGGFPVCSATTCTNLCAGAYTANVTDANGCTGASTIMITQPAMLMATISSTNATCSSCTNGAANVQATGGVSPYTCSWMPGMQTTTLITNLAVGCYTAQVFDNNGCSATATTCISFGTGVAQAQNENTNLMLYPNPSNGLFTVSNTIDTDKMDVTIVNTLGQTVIVESGKNVCKLTFDLSKASKGIYYAKVSTSEGTKLFKLILE